MLNSGKLKEVKNLLLVKLRGIGDAVLLTPSIKAVKEGFPDSSVTVITSPAGALILKGNPYIDEILVYDRDKPGNLIDQLKFLNGIRKKEIYLAINFHASFRSALFVYLSGAKFRIIHNHSGKNYFSNIDITAKKEQKSIIERDFDCLRTAGISPVNKKTEIYLTEEEKESGRKYLQNLLGTVPLFSQNMGLSPNGDCPNFVVGINPGANRPTKRWEEEKYAELADMIIENHKNQIVVFSGPGEEFIGEKILKLMKNRAYLIKNLNLREVAGIINHCSLFIGNDNGLFHMAVALGIPTITVFGPENPVEWHPYDHLPEGKHIIVSKKLICMNCGKLYCETNECIKSITVLEVFDFIEKWRQSPFF